MVSLDNMTMVDNISESLVIMRFYFYIYGYNNGYAAWCQLRFINLEDK